MHLNYRSEIDGLRAIAVLPVIFFHAGIEKFSGGFVGVDIFFVISGYLITSIIIKELYNKTFSLKNFYERRARRILPALIFVILITSFLSFFFLTRSELTSYFKSVNATLLFYSNFYFWKTTPYFQSESDLEPLLHTWSLSIEEQFYIIFPIILIFIFTFLKKYILSFFILTFFLSLIVCQTLALKTGGTLNFYFTISRVWELALGAIAAYTIINKKILISNLYTNLLSIFGFILIIFSIFFFNKKILYPSLYTLLPALGTVLIILFAEEKTFIKKLLSSKILVSIGLVSYSFYLWHQPLLAIGKIYLINFSLFVKIIIILIAFLASCISYKFIEKPFRAGIKQKKNRFIKNIFMIFLIINCFSFLVIQTFKKDSVFSTESNIAKMISQNMTVALPNLEKRNFSIFKIFHSNKKVENIVAGSSRIAFVGNEILKDKSLNLNVETATIEDQVALTIIGVEKFNPKRVFLSADPWLFNEAEFPPNSKRWMVLENELNYSLNKINNENITQNFKNFNNRSIYNGFQKFFDETYNNYNLRKKRSLEKNFLEGRHIVYPDGSERFAASRNNKTTGREFTHYFAPYIDSAEKKKLYFKFLNYLKHKDIEIFLVLVPIFETSYNASIANKSSLLDIESYFYNIAKKNNLNIIGSYNPNKIPCTKSEFLDDLHPDKLCVKKIFKNYIGQ